MAGSGSKSGKPVATGHNKRNHFLGTETVNKIRYYLLECR